MKNINVSSNMSPIVAHIHNLFFAKSETFIYNYISNLKRVHPICLAGEFVNLDQFPFPKEDIYYININIKKYTIRWFLNKRLGFGRDLKAEKIIKKRKVQLIHAHFGSNGVYSLKLKKRFRIPLVTTFYGYDISKLAKTKEWITRYKDLFQKGDLFLVEGEYMKAKLIELGCPKEKIQVQRIAIPVNKIPFLVKNPKKSNERVILIFSGRFVEKKGLIYALQAIEKVREKFKNFEFRIIGDGPLKREIEEFIKDHSMENYVKLLGFLTYEDYLKEMEKADIFVHPSVTASDGDSEGGAPTTILEAQAMGMPVVSTNHADIPNVTLPGTSALLSDERDCEMLIQNISFLLQNQDIWEKMGRAGRNFVEAHHDIKKEIVALEDKYDFILKQRQCQK